MSWSIFVQTGSLALYCELDPTWTCTFFPWSRQHCVLLASCNFKIFLGAANFIEKNALVEPLGETPHLDFVWTSALVPSSPSLSINPVCVSSQWPPAEFPSVSMIVASSETVKRGQWLYQMLSWKRKSVRVNGHCVLFGLVPEVTHHFTCCGRCWGGSDLAT